MSTKDDGLPEQNFLPKYEIEKGQVGWGKRDKAIYHFPPETLANCPDHPTPSPPPAFSGEAGAAGAEALFLEHSTLGLFLIHSSLSILKARSCDGSLFLYLVSSVLVTFQE